MKKYFNRYLSILLTFALVVAIPFAFTQEAQAASKKTKYVETSHTSTYTDSEGKLVSDTITTQYSKSGLSKSRTFSDGSKTLMIRNKKGDIIGYQDYDSSGKLTYSEKTSLKYNKKGYPVSGSTFETTDGKNQHISNFKYTNYKNGKVKKTVYNNVAMGVSTVTTYNKKGYMTSWSYVDGDYSTVEKYTYKFDKKGYPVKEVCDTTWKSPGGGSSTAKTVTTYKNSYDKHKNLKKVVMTSTHTNSEGTSSTNVRTITYKYKKVKVAKKYLRFFR